MPNIKTLKNCPSGIQGLRGVDVCNVFYNAKLKYLASTQKIVMTLQKIDKKKNCNSFESLQVDILYKDEREFYEVYNVNGFIIPNETNINLSLDDIKNFVKTAVDHTGTLRFTATCSQLDAQQTDKK